LVVEIITGDKRHRSELEIIHSILRVVRAYGVAKKTHIMNLVNLNTTNANKYLSRLVRAGVLEEERVGREIHYRLTGKGEVFASLLDTIVSMLSSDGASGCPLLEELAERGVEVRRGARLVSTGGVVHRVDYYLPGARAAVIMVDGRESLQNYYMHAAISLAYTGDVDKVVLVVPPSLYSAARKAVSAVDGAAARISVVPGCNSQLLEELGLAGRLGPHTDPHGPPMVARGA